jgi:hypothetical protein
MRSRATYYVRRFGPPTLCIINNCVKNCSLISNTAFIFGIFGVSAVGVHKMAQSVESRVVYVSFEQKPVEVGLVAALQQGSDAKAARKGDKPQTGKPIKNSARYDSRSKHGPAPDVLETQNLSEEEKASKALCARVLTATASPA